MVKKHNISYLGDIVIENGKCYLSMEFTSTDKRCNPRICKIEDVAGFIKELRTRFDISKRVLKNEEHRHYPITSEVELAIERPNELCILMCDETIKHHPIFEAFRIESEFEMCAIESDFAEFKRKFDIVYDPLCTNTN